MYRLSNSDKRGRLDDHKGQTANSQELAQYSNTPVTVTHAGKYVLSHIQAPKYVKRTVPRIADPHSISVIIGQLGHVMVDRRHVIALADR